MANLLLNMCDVTDFAGTVDDHKNIVFAFEKHQVIHDAAIVIEQQAVALLANGQVDHIDRHQALKRGRRVWPHQAQLTHVRDVKQPTLCARVQVLSHQTSGVLHWHAVAREGHHSGTQAQMQVMQRRAQEGFRRGNLCGQKNLQGQQTKHE